MIEIKGFTKKYGTHTAVENVTCSIQDDSVTGLLGLNGAGKTSLLKALCAYHFPTKGSIVVSGFSVTEHALEVKKRVGYVSEAPSFYYQYTVREFLRFIAEARLIAKTERQERIDSVIVDCGLESVYAQRIFSLSKGFRQRLALATALIHNPRVLILDEPTAALDPSQIIEMRSLLMNAAKTKTVVLSTHIMQEVEALCSSLIILHEGSLRVSGTVEHIIKSAHAETMEDAFLFYIANKTKETPV